MSQRLRNFVFTINNWTEDQLKSILDFGNNDCSYLVVGEECGESGTPHLQGYAELKKQTRFNTIHKRLFSAHIENRKGSARQAADYCKKEKIFHEVGKISNSGERTDLVAIRDDVLKNGRIEIENIQNLQQLRFAENTLKYSKKKREKIYVHWIWGKSGAGKTKMAIEKSGSDYYKWNNIQGKWFDGYNGEKILILDDLRPEDFKYTALLNMLDIHECRVEFKGGVRQLLAETIYITSNTSPHAFETSGEDNYQLFRRIHEITHLGVSKGDSEVGGNTNADLEAENMP